MINVIGTLTHDKYDPILYGFCFYFYHDKETGDIIIEHNGLEYATDKDRDLLLEVARRFGCEKES